MIVRRILWELFLAPRNLAIIFIRGWRAAISPLYGNVCRYYPSCSAYGLGSVQQFGLIRGGLMTLWRILWCNPWSRGGIDDVPDRMDDNFPLSRFGFARPPQKEN